MPNKSKITEKLTELGYSKRSALRSQGTTSRASARIQPCFPALSHAGLRHSVMIYLPRPLSCAGISTRTCNGYVAGRGHVYTARRRRYPSGWEGASAPTRNSGARCKKITTLKSPAVSKHVREWAQHCTGMAYIPQPSRIGAGGEIFVLICAVQGWQRCCAAFSQWQNEFFSQPPLCSKCRNMTCSFLLLTEHGLQPRRLWSEYTYNTIYVLNCWHTLSNNGFTSRLGDVWSPNLICKSRHFVCFCVQLRAIELIYGLSFWILNHTCILHFL